MWTYDELEETLRFPESVDSTMLSAFTSCPTKFFQEFILRKVPLGRSIDLHAGGCAARAFEVIRIAVFRDNLSLEEAFYRAWKEYLLSWPIDFDPKEGSYKDFTNVWGAVEAYFKQYPPKEDFFQPYVQEDGTPSVEFRFGIPTEVLHPTTRNPIIFAGRADMLAQHEAGTCYTLDEKTTHGIGPTWPYQWSMRGQFYGYVHAARTMGFPCVGAVTRGIAIQQTQYAFKEHTQILTRDQTDRWWRSAQRKLSQMVDAYVLTVLTVAECKVADVPIEECFKSIRDIWEMSYGDACVSYGGCRFRDLCVSAEPWELYHAWDTRIWDPLAHDPTKESENKLKYLGELTFEELMEGL